MNERPEIVITFPDCIGGVASFNRNIINHTSLRKHLYIHVILLKSKEDKRPPFNDPVSADKISRFSYSTRENHYNVYKRLNELIGNTPGAIVTDNDTTLNAASLFNNPKRIFMLVHDYYYVRLALLYEPVIDAAVAHSSFFKDILWAAKPEAYTQKSFYIPYGVEQGKKVPKERNEQLKLVFLGRLVKEKGVYQLIEIENWLANAGIVTQWTIIGTGPAEQDIRNDWKQKNNVSFHQPATTTQVYNLLQTQDIQVFPTLFEGTPVSILECMANGVIPVVSDLPGGIRDIVNENIGFRCPPKDVTSFGQCIAGLHNDREKLYRLQQNCIDLSGKSYNIDSAADDYFNFFLQHEGKNNMVKSMPIPLSRLDKPYLPNKLVLWIRNMIN